MRRRLTPFGTNTREAQIAGLKGDPLMFAPGTAISYSNYGFDLLGAALSNTGGKPYATLLSERVLAPLGMKDTLFNLRPGDEARVWAGHNFDGKPNWRSLRRRRPSNLAPVGSTPRPTTWRDGCIGISTAFPSTARRFGSSIMRPISREMASTRPSAWTRQERWMPWGSAGSS